MKFHFTIITFLLVLLSSCNSLQLVTNSPIRFYQIYTISSESVHLIGDSYRIDSGNISIEYNFWAEKGNGSFILYNNSDKEIFVDLGRSHLLVNGIAYTYYPNLTTESFSKLTTDGIELKINLWSPTHEASIANLETRIICIPPASGKLIPSYKLNSGIIQDCDYAILPKNGQSEIMKFNKDNSPLLYRNILTYSFSEDFNEAFIINNDFWMSELVNVQDTEFKISEEVFECERKPKIHITVYPFKNPFNFYMGYGWNDVELIQPMKSNLEIKSKADRLRKLKEIFDDGILTEDEYEKEKKKILEE